MPQDRNPAQLSPQTTRRNVAFSAVNHFFVEGAMNLSEASMVLTLLVKALGGSNLLAGLLPSLRFVGWLVPQFFAAGRLQRLSRFLPAVRFLEAIRSSFYLIIAGFTLAYGIKSPQLVLAVFYPLFLVTRLAAGSSAVARAELVARMVPPRERSTVVSVRRLAGGVGSFLSGLAVRYILDEKVSSFPANYALLVGLSGIGFALGIAALGPVKEAEQPIGPRVLDWRQQLKRVPALLKGDRRYMSYIGVGAAATGFQVAAPFYIIYATEVLGTPAAMAGFYISIRTLSRVLSNAFWGRQCRKRGNLWVLKVSCALGAVAPMFVVLLACGVPVVWADGVPAYVSSLFGLAFLVEGVALSGYYISRTTYLYDIAPERDRPTYFGLANTILGPFNFLPALAGALLDAVGFGPIFAAAAGMLGLAHLLASRLSSVEEPFRHKSRPPAQRSRGSSGHRPS